MLVYFYHVYWNERAYIVLVHAGLVILCFTTTINASTSSFGGCPDIPVKDNFDPERFLGTWYEIAASPIQVILSQQMLIMAGAKGRRTTTRMIPIVLRCWILMRIRWLILRLICGRRILLNLPNSRSSLMVVSIYQTTILLGVICCLWLTLWS